MAFHPMKQETIERRARERAEQQRQDNIDRYRRCKAAAEKADREGWPEVGDDWRRSCERIASEYPYVLEA